MAFVGCGRVYAAVNAQKLKETQDNANADLDAYGQNFDFLQFHCLIQHNCRSIQFIDIRCGTRIAVKVYRLSIDGVSISEKILTHAMHMNRIAKQ